MLFVKGSWLHVQCFHGDPRKHWACLLCTIHILIGQYVDPLYLVSVRVRSVPPEKALEENNEASSPSFSLETPSSLTLFTASVSLEGGIRRWLKTGFLESDKSCCKSLLHLLPAMWFWTSHSSSPGFSFLTYKM